MSTGTIDVWISGLDEPCSVDNRTWYVTIYDCDGRVLEWCGKRYLVLRAPCGHLEVQVPPGTYRISAVWGFYVAGAHWYGNHFTDSAIVQACCGEHVCVKLFTPSAHRCGLIFLQALAGLVEQKLVRPEDAKAAEQAVKKLVESMPKPVRGFELDHLDEIKRLVREDQQKQTDKPAPKAD